MTNGLGENESAPWRDHFSLDPDRVWLNASHQGPLPDVAAEAVSRMVGWKQRPYNLSTPEPFTTVPEQLRTSLAALIGADRDEVALANSSSYGLHLFANGLRLQPGDEVIVAANDFPSDILPWTRLRDDGVTAKQVQPTAQVLTVDEVRAAITDQTKVVCLTWVHSLSGHVIDLDAIGDVCRDAGVLFVVNASQGLGGIPIDITAHPIDALTSVGHKYLCGPYATGLAWIGERMADRLHPTKLYWLSALTADDLAQPQLDLEAIEVADTAARHDIFGTANFFNFAALAASVDLVANVGVSRVYAHNMALTERLVAGLDSTAYSVLSRGEIDQSRSAIIFLEPKRTNPDVVFDRLRQVGIDVARRTGKLRLSPHFYNTHDDIDRVLAALSETA